MVGITVGRLEFFDRLENVRSVEERTAGRSESLGLILTRRASTAATTTYQLSDLSKNDFRKHWTIQRIDLPIRHSATMMKSSGTLQEWDKRLQF